MIELEKTYLAKYLPENLPNCERKEVIDVYLPKASEHPVLRLRKNGDKYVMTKKEPVVEGDSSEMLEQTIKLTEAEFKDLNRQLDGRRVSKIRYQYDYNGHVAEIDVFQEELRGLVVVDFEFETVEAKNNFEMPEFCLAEVTQEKFIAGGMLCGKSYDDIEKDLERFNYSKIDRF